MASDLISRSAMLERLEKWNTPDCIDKAFYEFTKSRINEQPTVDAKPVVHGEWIWSECDKRFGFVFDNDYCPNCGADMRGDEE